MTSIMAINRKPLRVRNAVILSALLLGVQPSLLARENLQAVRNLQLTGFEEEPDAVKEHLLKQADLYMAYREGRNRQAYSDDCAQPSELPKPFCALEQARLVFYARRPTRRIVRSPQSVHKNLLSSILKFDEKVIASANLKDLKNAANKIEKNADLERLSVRIISQTHCSSAAVGLAVASKIEERFPNRVWIDRATAMYKKGADCLPGAEGTYARYRTGMLNLWTKGCRGLSEWLQPVLQNVQGEDALQVRTRYWQYYCAVKTNNKKLAKQKKEELRNFHPMSFYNLLVNKELPLKQALPQDKTDEVLLRSIKRPELNLLAMALEALLQVNADLSWMGELAEPQLEEVRRAEPQFQLYISALLERGQQGLAKFRLMGPLLFDIPKTVTETSLKMYFPIWYFDRVSEVAGIIDPFLILGLIRQESAFNPRAESQAGARGLMQVMPATARSFGVTRKEHLFDPDTSIEVGTKFFEQRLRQFSGDVEMTLAAYNAGSHRVNDWVKRYPVDRRMLFLDLIPFRETREYVTLIMRNYLWYSKLYSGRELFMAKDRKLAKTDPAFDLKFISLSQEEKLKSR